MNDPRPSTPAARLRDERTRRVVQRLRVLFPIVVTVHLAHVLVFSTGAAGDNAPRWRGLVLGSHELLAAALACLWVAFWRSPASSPWLRWLGPGLGLTYALAGAFVAGVDQLITPSVTAYVLVIFGLAFCMLLTRAQALAINVVAYAAFALAQRYFQPNHAILLSNMVNGLSTSGLGFCLAVVLSDAFDRDFHHERTIEAQGAELADSLVALRASHEQLEEALGSVRQLADRSESANRAKSEFLANVSHEIRTPMNAVLGFCEILARDVRDPAQRRRLAGIESASRTLLRLIEDILDLSRMESGSVTLQLEAAHLGPIVHEVAALLAPRAQGVALEVEVDDSLSEPAMIDGTRVRQVLLNLVGNALKFTAAGSVRVRARRVWDAGVIELEVQDTGIGIPRKDQERIFEPFVQQSGTTSRRYGGAGLGLSITRQLVRAMQGSVRLTSAPGVGSTFTVTLPDLRVPRESVRASLPTGDSWDFARVSEPDLSVASRPPPTAQELAGALAALDGPLRAQQQDCLRLLRTDRTESLVRALTDLASCAPPVARYTQALASALEDFDVQKIKQVLGRFEPMVAEVRVMAGGGP